MKSFLQRIQFGGLLFDGAIGTQLYERGVFLTRCFEEISVSEPGLIAKIHEDYCNAGAEVLTTNTWGANRVKLAKHGVESELVAINQASVQIAHSVAQKGASRRAYVLGSIGPTGLSGTGNDVKATLAEQISILADTPVDALLLETFSDLDELLLALSLCRATSNLPVCATFTYHDDKDLHDPSAISVREAEALRRGKALLDAGASAIGVNCSGGAGLIFQLAAPLVQLGAPVIAQPNAGLPLCMDGRTIYTGNPEYFGVFAKRFFKAGISAVGGCCGTGPEHIRRMSSAARLYAARGASHSVQTNAPAALAPEATSCESDGAASPKALIPLENRSKFAAKLARGEFLTSVELNPPTGISLSSLKAPVEALRDFGISAINIADGPRASMRMENSVMAKWILDETGVEPMIHVCTRDRNLLGLQAHLLGLQAQGINNVVVITGDPPKMGSYGHATGVYDVDSIGLLEIIAGFNAGFDPTGKPLPEPCRFLCATGAEPEAAEYDREIRRLELKKAAGAEIVFTQPVYDPSKAEKFIADIAHINIPVMIGICPLASLRNAEFLNANVPGMQIPKNVMDRLRDAEARGIKGMGIEIAREALLAIKDRVQGAYIMPPFGRAQSAIQLLQGVI